MANTLPNKITKSQAENAANETYARVYELKDVYEQIAEAAAAGAYTLTVQVATAEIADYVKAELLLDGYTLSGEDINITITWGQAPVL